jgi:hypothetical protein
MFLATDATALAVETAIETTTLAAREASIGHHTRLGSLNPSFSAFKMPGFALGQRAVSDSSINAPLLPLLTTVNSLVLLHWPRACGDGQRQRAE